MMLLAGCKDDLFSLHLLVAVVGMMLLKDWISMLLDLD
jgi:hypothetical protein